MSIFSPALDKFSSKYFIAPKDEYDVKVGTPKLKSIEITKGKKAGSMMHIVSFPTNIQSSADGDATLANKPLNIDFIVEKDNDDSFRRLFIFAMCCNGITPGSDEADAKFREVAGDKDWSLDLDSGTLGAGYTSLADSRVIVAVDKRVVGEGATMKEYQDYKGCRVLA